MWRWSCALSVLILSGGCSSDSDSSQGICVPGQLRCAGNAIEACATDGRSWRPSGSCAPGQYCSAGVCLAQPAGCGDQTCATGETCQSCSTDCGACCGNGACEPNYGEDADRCAVDCRSSPSSDSGPSGGACTSHEECLNRDADLPYCANTGTCAVLPKGFAVCGGRVVNLSIDPEHCGACGTVGPCFSPCKTIEAHSCGGRARLLRLFQQPTQLRGRHMLRRPVGAAQL